MQRFRVGQNVVAKRDLYDIKKGEIVTVTSYARPTSIGEWVMIKGRKNRSSDDSYEEMFFDAAITIEPGKHYRLRNGKVTGRVSVGDIGFEAVVDGQVKVFDKAGGHVFGNGELDIVEAWAPKVGERVKCTLGLGWATVSRVDEDGMFTVVWDNGDKGSTRWRAGKDFEPLLVADPAQPAVLKIEAGKFYRTRDGRKVGPMKPREGLGGEYVWMHDRGHRIYKANGENYDPGANDLIAEWVDEPVAQLAVAASNDNTPSTAGFTIPLVDEEPETLTLMVTADTAQAEAAFDRIIAKLERIAELQEQLGLRAA